MFCSLRTAIITLVLLSGVMATPAAPQSGISLTVMPKGAPKASNLLRSCPNKSHVRAVRQLVASWLQTVESLELCDIDSFLYYNPPEQTRTVLNAAKNLSEVSSGRCKSESDALQIMITNVSNGVNLLTDDVRDVCQMSDSENDVKRKHAKLQKSLTRLCGNISDVLPEEYRNGC